MQFVTLLILICVESLQGFQYTGSTFFAFASQKKESPSSASMSKSRGKGQEDVDPDIIFRPGMPHKKEINEDICADMSKSSQDESPDVLNTQCNVNADIHDTIKDSTFAIDVETTYSYNEYVIKTENESDEKEKTSEGYISLAISFYLHLLQSSALLTKCLTAGFIGAIGDICAQMFEHRMSNGAKFVLHKRRLLGIAFECSAVSGPIMHYAYDFLETMVPIQDVDDVDDEKQTLDSANFDDGGKSISSMKKWAAALFHVLSDTFLLGPIYVLSMMATSSLFEGRMNSFKADLALDFFPTFKASIYSSLGFLPMQVFAFRMLPSQFRLLYMNLQDIIWNAVVSFMAHKSRH